MNRMNKRLTIVIIVIFIFLLFSIFAPKLAPHNPGYSNLNIAKMKPNEEFLFGTDSLGRCVLSRILCGMPMSIYTTLFIVSTTLIIGSTLGLIAGYKGGMVDGGIMRLVDVFLAFPGMVLAIAVAGILGPGLNNAVIALIATGWSQYTRLSRNLVIRIKNENYIHVAKLNGQGTLDIMFRHILPNIVRPLTITASLSIGGTILNISALSFLGLGIQPPAPEWGSMISAGKGLIQSAPWIVLYPSSAVFLTAILFNIFGEHIRDSLQGREKYNFINF